MSVNCPGCAKSRHIKSGLKPEYFKSIIYVLHVSDWTWSSTPFHAAGRVSLVETAHTKTIG
jgi:hypothetical protein